MAPDVRSEPQAETESNVGAAADEGRRSFVADVLVADLPAWERRAVIGAAVIAVVMIGLAVHTTCKARDARRAAEVATRNDEPPPPPAEPRRVVPTPRPAPRPTPPVADSAAEAGAEAAEEPPAEPIIGPPDPPAPPPPAEPPPVPPRRRLSLLKPEGDGPAMEHTGDVPPNPYDEQVRKVVLSQVKVKRTEAFDFHAVRLNYKEEEPQKQAIHVFRDLVRIPKAVGICFRGDWRSGFAFSPDGQEVQSAGGSGYRLVKPIVFYNVGPMPLDVGTLRGPGDWVALTLREGEYAVWEDNRVTLGSARPIGVTAVAVSPDGRRIASAGKDGTVKVWDANDGAVLATLPGHTLGATAVAFSPDGTTLAAGSGDGSVVFWDGRGRDYARAAVLQAHRSGDVTAVAFAPDGRSVATGGHDATAKLWRPAPDLPERWAPAAEFLHPNRVGAIWGVAFAPDGRRLVVCAAAAHLWDPADGGVTNLDAHPDGGVLTAAFSPDGATVAVGNADGTVNLFDVRTASLSATLRGAKGRGRAVAFSPDGAVVAAAGADGVVRAWEADSGRPAWERERSPQAVTALAFSPDGTRLVSASVDRTVARWDFDARP